MSSSTRRGLALSRYGVGLAVVLAACGGATGQVVDQQIPLNFNHHGMAQNSESLIGATAGNADIIKYRSIADRGLVWDPFNTHAFGSLPLVGATGVTYGLFNVVGYSNATSPQAMVDSFDCIHIGNRVLSNTLEPNAIPTTNVGGPTSWTPSASIASLTGDGTTVTVTTSTAHGFSVGNAVAIQGATPASHNGNFTITSTPTPTSFTYASTNTAAISPSIMANNRIVTSISGSGTAVTVVTATAHNLAVNGAVYIQGADNAGYNGQFTVATVPNTTTFTVTNGATGAATGTLSPTAVVLDHSTTDQTTVLSSPIVVDQATEIGVLYMASNGPGAQIDCVLTFNNGVSDTNVTVRLAAPDWFGNPANPAIIAGQPITSQTKMTHIDGGTTFFTFQGVANDDAAALQNFSLTNAGPNLNVMEAVISVPMIIAAGNNVAGQSLTKIAFRNATWGSTTISSLNGNGTLATATVSSTAGFVPGQPIVIAGASVAGLNGAYTINSVLSATQFTYANTTVAASTTGTRTVQRVGIGRAYAIYAMSARTGSPVNAVCGMAQAAGVGDNPGTNSHAFGGSPTSCGGGNDGSAVWYSYTASGTHLVEARTCGAPFDTTMAIYSACNGAEIACNDNACALASRVSWNATVGQTYLIRVAGKNNATGTFTLQVADPAPVDITMPLQFNWNGICHGAAEQTLPTGTGAGQGSTHENRSDLNGYRSIADRGLLADGSAGTLNFGGTIGYEGMVYEVYSTPLQADMVHLGRRDLVANMARTFSPPGTLWPAQGGTSTSNNGLSPLWLDNIDHTTPSTSSMAALSAVMGPNTKIGILYQSSDVPTNAALQRFASIDVTLSFTDATSVTVPIFANDWFWNNAQVLPGPTPTQGAEAQRVLGTFRGVQNTDRGDDTGTAPSGGWLKVNEAVISTQSLIGAGLGDVAGKTLASITFGNPTTYANAAAMNSGTTNNFTSGMAVYAATLRNPASFNLNFGPSAVGTVTPNQLPAGGAGRMTVNVSRGSGSPNNITSVIVNASSIGLTPTLALNDSGFFGDQVPNDNVWSTLVSFPINSAPGSFSLPFTVTDAQSRTAMNNIIFSIVSPTASFEPATVFSGDTTKLRVNLSPATGGNTDIATVTVDGAPIGLGTISLFDDGTNGDVTSDDGVWSADIAVPAATPGGTYAMTYTVTDMLSRMGMGSASLTVIQVDNIGTIGNGETVFNGFVNPAEIRWIRFTIANPIDASLLNYFDVDTEGSLLTTTNDTELGLYDSAGNLIASDDDDGSGNLTALSFGLIAPARPATADGTAFNGRDGATLAAGTYLMAYSGFNTTFNATNFSATSTSTYTGPITIRMRIGIAPTGGAPTTFTDLGTIAVGTATSPTMVTNTQPLSAGGVQWFRFTVPVTVDGAILVREYFDIDTEGSVVPNTIIGVFADDGAGTLVLTDDNDGSGTLSQLSFGRGTRPAPGDGLAYNGRDGVTLAAGTYYLAVTEPTAGFANNFIVGFNTGVTAGDITVNIKSGIQSPVLHGPVNNPANNHDYYLLDIGFSFTDARTLAQSFLEGDLASIADANENEFVRSSVLRFDGADRRAWIGFTDEVVEGTFAWTDGSPDTFTNWNAGEPNDGAGGEDYTEMLGDGLWNDIKPLGVGTPGGGNHALVEVESGCVADFNGNGAVTVQDIFDFLGAYFTNNPNADVNDSGSVTVQDIFDYLTAYFTGCP